jgi:hypothetical protein
MKKSISFLLFCFLFNSSFLIAQTSDEKIIADRVESLRNLMIHPDKTGLEELAADDLSFGHSTGLVEDKTNFVDSYVKGKTVFTSATISNQTIKISGDIAIVRHHLTGDTNNNNVPGKVDLLILLIWQRQIGQWKLLARQGVKIPVQTN